MNLWTVPASDQASLLNIPKSLSGSVDPAVLAAFGLPSPLYAWGARIGTNNTANVLERMKPGDVCLFYTLSTNASGRRYNRAGRIVRTTQNRDLGQAIWGNPDFELV